MTGRLCEAPEPAMYTNGSPVSRRFVGGGASGALSCGISTARDAPAQRRQQSAPLHGEPWPCALGATEAASCHAEFGDAVC